MRLMMLRDWACDATMADADVDIELKAKGIRVVVNPDADKRHRQPNKLQNAASYLFNEISIVRDDLTKQRRHVLALSKVLQRKAQHVVKGEK